MTVLGEELTEFCRLEQSFRVVIWGHAFAIDGLVEFLKASRRLESHLGVRLLNLLELLGVVYLLYFRDCLADLLVSHCTV